MNDLIQGILDQLPIKKPALSTIPSLPGALVAKASVSDACEICNAFVKQFDRIGLWPVMLEPGSSPQKQKFESDGNVPPEGTAEQLLAARYKACLIDFASVIGTQPASLPKHEFAKLLDASGAVSHGDKDDLSWPGKPLKVGPSSDVLFDDNGKLVRSVPIALVPAEHPSQILQRLGFGGYNDCPSPAFLTAVFREWHRDFGAEIAIVTDECIECSVEHPPQTPEQSLSLAVDHYLICPDLIDQGTGSFHELARNLWRNESWVFWWD